MTRRSPSKDSRHKNAGPQPPVDKRDEFNQLSKVVAAEYAAVLLATRDLSVLYMEHKFDEMLPGLKKLPAGSPAVEQLTSAIVAGWFPLADDSFPIDGPARDALRRDFAHWLTGAGKSTPAVRDALLHDLTGKLERDLYRCGKDDKEALFTLLRATGAPVLADKLAEAKEQVKIAKQHPDQEIVDDFGAVQTIIPNGRLATARAKLVNVTALKKDYDESHPPALRKPGFKRAP